MEWMSSERTCSHCDASMQEGQDWCLKCGAGGPRSGRTGPGWRTAALVLGSTGVLVLGAAAAAYAALQQSSPAKPPTPAVAQTPLTTTTTSTTTTPTVPPPSTGTPQLTPPPSPTTPNGTLNTPSTPPKIPGVAETPSTTTTTTSRSKSTTSTTSTTTSGTSSSGTGTSTTSTTSSSTEEAPEEETLPSESEGKPGQPVAVLLDTNAAQTYNPRKLLESRFGDPSLAIDGDTTTAWTMQLEGGEAPNVGAGLSLNLKAPLKIAQVTLITQTLGVTVQVYGTKSKKLPQKLSSKEWVQLSHAHVVKKRRATIKLSGSKKSFRQLLVWIVKAPVSATGQLAASEVAVNEIQLYEPPSGGGQV
jgi:hypothetical protein